MSLGWFWWWLLTFFVSFLAVADGVVIYQPFRQGLHAALLQRCYQVIVGVVLLSLEGLKVEDE
mgnify:FL=1|jgi:hypothetical protein